MSIVALAVAGVSAATINDMVKRYRPTRLFVAKPQQTMRKSAWAASLSFKRRTRIRWASH